MIFDAAQIIPNPTNGFCVFDLVDSFSNSFECNVMFHLYVIKDDEVIQYREYSSAGVCTEKVMAALEYYVGKKEKVLIRMTDAKYRLIKQLDSEKGFGT